MRNYGSIDQEYLFLMELYFRVVDLMRGQTITDENKWLVEAEVLGAKLFNHVGTIHYLRNGTILSLPGHQPKTYIDHSSISIIARAAFETYLTFYFIFCDVDIPIEERHFRHSIWKLKGFLDRQNFKIVRKENLPKLEQEKWLATELITEIERSNTFKTLPTKKQTLAKKGEWRLGLHWVDLANLAGFNKEIFRDVYSHLCSYSHSGGLSVLQIGQAVQISDQHQLSNVSLQYGLILMSHFIKNYGKVFPDAMRVIRSNSELEGLTDKWHITWNEVEFLKPFSHNLAAVVDGGKARRP
jgi:hypothetical protein